MKLRLRERAIIWGSDKPWINKYFVERATRNDIRLAEEEFNKVEGSGLGPLRRKDGSVLAKPVRFTGMNTVQNMSASPRTDHAR